MEDSWGKDIINLTVHECCGGEFNAKSDRNS